MPFLPLPVRRSLNPSPLASVSPTGFLLSISLIISTHITWKEGKDVTVRLEKKKQKKKGSPDPPPRPLKIFTSASFTFSLT